MPFIESEKGDLLSELVLQLNTNESILTQWSTTGNQIHGQL